MWLWAMLVPAASSGWVSSVLWIYFMLLLEWRKAWGVCWEPEQKVLQSYCSTVCMWPEILQHCIDKQWLSPLGRWLCGTQVRTEPRIKGRGSSLKDRTGCWVSRPGSQSQEGDIYSSCTCWKVFQNSSGWSNKQSMHLNLKKLISSHSAYQYKGVHAYPFLFQKQIFFLFFFSCDFGWCLFSVILSFKGSWSTVLWGLPTAGTASAIIKRKFPLKLSP